MNRRHGVEARDAASAAWWLVPMLLVLAMLAAAFLVGLLEQLPEPATPLLAARPAR